MNCHYLNLSIQIRHTHCVALESNIGPCFYHIIFIPISLLLLKRQPAGNITCVYVLLHRSLVLVRYQTNWVTDKQDRQMVGGEMGDEQQWLTSSQSCVSHMPQPFPLSQAEKHHSSLCRLWAAKPYSFPPHEQGSEPKPFGQVQERY